MQSSSQKQAMVPKRHTQPSGRGRKRILKEDEYTQRLGWLIKRDFFPDLVRLEAQVAFMECLESMNPEGMMRHARKLDELDHPIPPEEDEPLSVFLEQYTSQDNHSFEELLDSMNVERRKKLAWIQQKALSIPTSVALPPSYQASTSPLSLSHLTNTSPTALVPHAPAPTPKPQTKT